MKVLFLFVSVFLIVTACSEPDTICACLETGKKLDKTAQEILTKGTSPALERELKALKTERGKRCAEFERMDGEAMLKRMKDCE